MRTIQQEIPKEQKEILDVALQAVQKVLSITDNYLNFDVMTLRALLKYKITVEVTQEQLDKFAITEDIDFPDYTN